MAHSLSWPPDEAGRRLLLGGAIGLAVAAFGLWETGRGISANNPSPLAAVAMGVAAGTYRVKPALALALVWAAAVLQVLLGRDVAFVQLATLLVAYGTARYGRPVTVWASGVSIPIGAVLALAYIATTGTDLPRRLGLYRFGGDLSAPVVANGLVLVLAALAGPWLVGLLLRVRDAYRRSVAQRRAAEAEAERHQEIAGLEAAQARLARDVHDVVGHSLTVILAQADSAQFYEDADIAKIRSAMEQIAATARSSLGDVRQVLASTSPDAAPPRPPGGLDELIEGVRGAGHDLRLRVEGLPQPMPPELDVVAYRVLQEMLTNAIRHGRRDLPIFVDRTWGADELRLEVRNAVQEMEYTSGEGLGLPGMARRLEAVGGRLRTRREDVPEGTVQFTVTADVPVRPKGGR
ncbi:sensor histidine kinase [Motilibacter aurantiacus]|uniref:sensor histidine kinase n=1 Tax=Motilibacter aurantiacus TaxID=2714955 RepID=UPI00140AEDA0|nr:histidine kinase [Motilibacter aurantiacus]NHC44489.1 hypothetical protein [Motilibacter aurantiacus]